VHADLRGEAAEFVFVERAVLCLVLDEPHIHESGAEPSSDGIVHDGRERHASSLRDLLRRLAGLARE
jgi:hypothetical protein